VPRIRRSNIARPGITRRRYGRGFAYLAPDGKRVTDVETLDRIKALVIPPAWNDVWISDDPVGHIQAVGYDAAGRKQYLYHPRWRANRDKRKFERMLDFARVLPELRRAVAAELDEEGLSRTRVLALAVRLIDLGLFRIGNEGYARQNGSFGLATIQTDHVTVSRDGTMTFDYVGKAGKRHVLEVKDPQAAKVVAQLKRRPGNPELLAFQDESGGWIDVRSSDINDYLKSLTSGFTAKDFRTWSATVMAAVFLAESADRDPRVSSKRVAAEAVQRVAEQLGNTPAVCRGSYISPRVLDEYFAGVTIAPAIKAPDAGAVPSSNLTSRVELAVMELLEGTAPPARAA
jgi:DNA topoisomerase-1